MSRDEIDQFLDQLSRWKAEAPINIPADVPRQELAIVDENYLRAVSDVTRPRLDKKGNAVSHVDEELLIKCATSATEACEVSIPPSRHS